MHMVTFVEALIFPCATGTHACPFGSQYPKVSQRGLVVFFRKERTWRVERARALEAAQAPLCFRHLPTLRIRAATRPP